MGLGPQSLNLTFSLWLEGHFKAFKRVMEIGSQDLHSDPGEVTRALSAITKNPDLPRVTSAEGVYRSLGFEVYRCIDSDGLHGALVLNLNEDIRSKGFTEQFDLVTNHGTTEHCFDQFNALRNVHNLCSKGGIMLHALPFQGYLNHGFYNYQPNFYQDLAGANSYELIGMFINIDSSTGDLCSYSNALMKHLTIAPGSTMGLFVVLRKTVDEEFRIPFQGKYAGTSRVDIGYEFKRLPSVFLPLGLREMAWEIPAGVLFRNLMARIWRKMLRMLRLR